MPKLLINLITIITLLFACADLCADEFGEVQSGWSVASWAVMTSVYTKHFDPEPYHENNQKLIGVEAGFRNHWLAGVSIFDNSFGQNSQFAYMGYSWNINQSDYWYFKLRGGLLHGYKEPYEDKIPLNGMGIAPVIVPAVGFKYRNFVSEMNIAGAAAVTFTVGFQFE